MAVAARHSRGMAVDAELLTRSLSAPLQAKPLKMGGTVIQMPLVIFCMEKR